MNIKSLFLTSFFFIFSSLMGSQATYAADPKNSYVKVSFEHARSKKSVTAINLPLDSGIATWVLPQSKDFRFCRIHTSIDRRGADQSSTQMYNIHIDCTNSPDSKISTFKIDGWSELLKGKPTVLANVEHANGDSLRVLVTLQ